ncbi:hypothetical protein TNCV_4485051 [Trichonephila clavipes]|nr:hypothetical protein TNCV_4485051 [Trichonephila clavipes]
MTGWVSTSGTAGSNLKSETEQEARFFIEKKSGRHDSLFSQAIAARGICGSLLKEVVTDQPKEEPAERCILFMIEKRDEHETKGKFSNAF